MRGRTHIRGKGKARNHEYITLRGKFRELCTVALLRKLAPEEKSTLRSRMCNALGHILIHHQMAFPAVEPADFLYMRIHIVCAENLVAELLKKEICMHIGTLLCENYRFHHFPLRHEIAHAHSGRKYL